MSDPVLVSLLVHTCDLQTAAAGTPSDDTYGHEGLSYAPPVAVKTGIICRLRPLSSREMVQMGFSSTALNTYNLYLLPGDLPATLTMVKGMGKHQIVNVKRTDGSSYDTGPFDIVGVIEPSAIGHHIKLIVSRVSGEIYTLTP